MMMNKEMSRKEFLKAVLAFACGLLILKRLPFGGSSKTLAKLNPGSYGNDIYGGTNKK